MQYLKTLLIVSPLFLTACQFDLSLPEFDASNQAALAMQAMTVGQQAFYDANGHFASSVESLSLNLNLETQDYRYTINTEGQYAQTVLMTAAAKTDNLPSYSGVVTMGSTEGGLMALANICKTDQPSPEPPPMSSTPIPGEGLKCPPGSSAVRQF